MHKVIAKCSLGSGLAACIGILRRADGWSGVTLYE